MYQPIEARRLPEYVVHLQQIQEVIEAIANALWQSVEVDRGLLAAAMAQPQSAQMDEYLPHQCRE
jgi:hypothetical protein